ncbi:MAG: hypothetical protein A2W05_03145 [Candidatus Schekmanbacteria bacterium RBG_16_38_10]|uniref:Uncharacterized protein n=1 Tax=Candidatus Schekmanbacteria bacterium RBG_16_38_10 TaxID=1817879 RepID=A0A1F7RMX9_9BACT|nr:MAG: hypothetical protein A2W05_03145 [Candidatus Schekmanbacteria bacterium RBG_16_38_10]
MNIVKYCKSAHVDDAIKKGKIFVGTFSYYKKIENEGLRDIEEGPAIPAVVDNDNEIIISENENDTLLTHSSIKMANGWKLQLPKGMPLWLEQPDFNTFIFCVSEDSKPTIEKAKRLGYESFYKITDPSNFGKALMWSMMKHLKSPFGVTGYMGKVNYVPRKIQVVNHNNPSLPPTSFSSADFFTKHERFSADEEYRYVVLEYSNIEKTQFNSFNTDGFLIENKEISKWVKKA